MSLLTSLRVDGSAFFGAEMTYMALARDAISCLSGIVLLKQMFAGGRLSSAFVSAKTLILFLMVFITKLYDDYPFPYITYEVASTLILMMFSLILLIVCVCLQGSMYNDEHDTFRLPPLLTVSALLALFFNYGHLDPTPSVLMRAWSHYLNAISLFPQFWLMANTILQKTPCRPIQRYLGGVYFYVNAQVACRMLDVAHWIFMYWDVDALDSISIVSDCLFIGAYAAFFLYIGVYRAKLAQKLPK